MFQKLFNLLCYDTWDFRGLRSLHLKWPTWCWSKDEDSTEIPISPVELISTQNLNVEFHSTKVSQLLHSPSCLSKFSQKEYRGTLSRDWGGKEVLIVFFFWMKESEWSPGLLAGELFIFSSALLQVNIFFTCEVLSCLKLVELLRSAARSMFSCRSLQCNCSGYLYFCFNAPLDSKMKKANLDF